MIRFLRRARYWLLRDRLEDELAEELEVHRQLKQARLEASGLSEADAALASRRALGNLTMAREDARAIWIWPWLESLWQDLAYAVRMLRRAPGFAAAVILVMALGTGATTGVSSLIDALVIRSLPVRDPERLVYFSRPSFSYPVFQEVRARGAHIFSGLFAWNLDRLPVEWTTEIESTEVLTASGDFYSTLGVGAVAGRTFGPDDDRIGGGSSGLVAVISHGCWQRRFHGEPSVIGRTLRIEGRPFTIVGVTPPGFFGVAAGLAPEITIPLTSLKNAQDLRAPFVSWVHLMGRLRDSLPVQHADAAAQAMWSGVLEATTNPDMPADRRAMYLARRTSLETGRTGYSRVRNQFEDPLWMLLALVALLLAIACAGASNLLLARGDARSREFAVRLAIGASRARVVRQMLTEAVIWAILAGAVGMLLARWGSAALIAMMATSEEPIVLEADFDWRIRSFALVLAFVTAATATLVAAVRAVRLDAGATLKTAGPVQDGPRRRWSFGSALVASQVALALILLVGAALFMRSLQRVLSLDAGVDRDHVLVMKVEPMAAGYRGALLTSFYHVLVERLGTIPGVESVSLSWYPPISNEEGAWTQSIGIDGAPPTPVSQRTVYFNGVSPGYFRTVGMDLREGRDFSPHDTLRSAKVAIVNESLVREHFNGRNPTGRRITIGRHASRRGLEIVGVVSDARYRRLEERPASTAYLPLSQLAETVARENLFAEVRAAGSIGSVGEGVRGAVRSMDPRVPVRIETVSDRIRESLVRERVIAKLAVCLGLAALTLASAALYGLLSYGVSRRSREIGLRIALGADRRAVIWMVVRECFWLATVGIVIGLGASLALGRYARTLLHQIDAADGVSLTAASLLMLMVAGLAGLLPAVRAARVDPATALRSD